MLRFSRNFSVCILLLIFSEITSAQNCELSISGIVKDLDTDSPIAYASVYIKESQSGELTDSLGLFKFESICEGEVHLVLSHIGCETQELFLEVSRDTIITLYLDHNSRLLDEVAVISLDGKTSTQESQGLNSASIAENSNKSLANMLEGISGVSTIKNGNGIAKPVVHGLYGNRLSILNNGIAQSGQQWGADHSPEIDPLVANKITVIKGVGALEFQGSALGSVVLVEPQSIDEDPHLHGEGRYFFESNGLGNGINLELQQYGKAIAWRAVGTLKKSGDNRSSKYFLRNTGHQEANIALQLEKSWSKKFLTELYFSSFNAEFGVLRGSHIGNLSDLEEALGRDVPFFTEDKFSFEISSPYQRVNHHLLKFHSKYTINEKNFIDFTYAGQYNLRKEFDIRRGGKSEVPALSLKQTSNFIEGKYTSFLPKNWNLKSGVQLNRVDNTNLPETGILPLIPDYISYQYGFFSILSKRIQQTRIEFGGRYDVETRNVAAISATVPRTVIRYQNDYYNYNAMAGISQNIFNDWKVVFNLGYASRNPGVNELYSNGLHQGVSGIEEGDPRLKPEISIKGTLSLKGNISHKLFFECLVYSQNIDNYIFLNPQNEIRLTIRGAFPVFQYEQTNARISGFDFSASYEASDRLSLTGKFSYLEGHDLTNDLYLVYMPSNNLNTALNYEIPEFLNLQNVVFQVNNRIVFQQKNLLPSQDFLAPPKTYYLFGIKVSTEKQLRKNRLKVFLSAENLLNETYRDYLNRQRYFADDLGFNLIAGMNFSF